MKDNKLSVVVCSCDKYSDVWEPFFKLFFKYWGNIKFPLYLLSNSRVYEDQNVTTILTGEDKDWSSNIIKALDNIKSDYILLLMEDYLLTKKVDNSIILNLLEYMDSKSAGYLRLFPCPGPTRINYEINDIEIGVIDPGAQYRASLQAAIWKRQTLLDLLLPGESAWEFEVYASKRSNNMNKQFFSVSNDSFPNIPLEYFCTGVIKGYWVKEAVELCYKHEIKVDLNYRKIEPWYIRLRRGMYDLLYRLKMS